MSTDDAAQGSIDALLDAVTRRLRAGESVDLDALAAAHPRHAEELRRVVPILSLLESAGGQPSSPSEPIPAPPLPESLGPYRVLREIGRGGMGRVFEGASPSGERVALKLIHPHLLAEARHRDRFLREAEVGQQVSHPAIVATLDTDLCDLDGASAPFIVLEYVAGQTLRELLDSVGAVPERLACLIGQRVAEALAALHAQGIVHRDVKPENIVITSDEEVKLMDLGVAYLLERAARFSRTGEFVGSLLYAAPEQLRGAEPGPSADVYALGLVLYELVTSEHPQRGSTGRVPPPPGARGPSPGDVRTGISPFVDSFIAHLLEPDPEKRPGDAAALARILETRERSAWWRSRAAAAGARRMRLPVDDWVTFQGRAEELARLEALHARAEAGHGHTFLIQGEGGLGKSRLLGEWLTRMQERATSVHVGVAGYAPGATTLAVPPLDEAIRAMLPEEGLGPHLEALLGAETRIADVARRYLEGGPDVEALRIPGIARAAIHERILTALAGEQPVVLVMEDLHFGGEAAWTIFRGFARTLPAAGVLLIGTARPPLPDDVGDEFAKNPDATIHQLAGLEERATRALLGEALGERAARSSGAHELVRLADGSPFCVLEFARELQRRQAEQLEDVDLVAMEIPASVQQIVDARIQPLQSEQRELLSLAACAGERWDPEVVCDTLGIARLRGLRTLHALDREHGLIRADGESYRFRHHLVQEALYDELTPALRRAYHGALADAVQDGRPDDGPMDGSTAFALARHRLLAGQVEQAAPYLRSGLEHLESSGEFVQAERMAQRAEEACERVPPATRAHVLGILGRVLADRSPRDARATYERALQCAPAEATSLRARLASGLATCLSRAGDITAALELGEEAVALAKASHDDAVAGEALGQLAMNRLRSGDGPRAEAAAREALDLARRAGDPWRLAATATSVGEITLALGDVEAARLLAEEAHAVASGHADRRTELASLHLLGKARRLEGRLEAALPVLQRTRELARAAGTVRSEAAAWISRNLLLTEVGRTAESVAEAREVLAFVRAYDQQDMEVYATMMLGTSLLVRGQMEEAETRLRGAIDQARHQHHLLYVQKAQMHLAVLLMQTGRLDEASALVDEIAAGGATAADAAGLVFLRAVLAEAHGDVHQAKDILASAIAENPDAKPYNTMRLRLVAARMAVWCGAMDEARDLLEVVLDVARRVELRPVLAAALILQGALAERHLLAARVALEDHGSALPTLERIVCTFLAGRAHEDAALLSRAWDDGEAYLRQVPEAHREATRSSPLFSHVLGPKRPPSAR